jgi:polar amino acid transport system substrate-binding protein
MPARTLRRTPLLLSLLLAALPAARAAGPTLVLYYEERPPLMSREQNQLIGVEGAPATAALQRAGIEVELREAPVARQVALIDHSTEAACALGLYRTPEREKLGKYSRHPIYTSPPQGLMIRADGRLGAAPNFAAILGARANILVLRNGYSYGAEADQLLAKAHAKIIRSSDNSLARARLVLKGVADGTLFTAEEGEALIKQLGDEGADLALRHYPDTPPGAGRFFFCSRAVSDSTIRALDGALGPPRPGMIGAR